MNETAQAKESLKTASRRSGVRRFPMLALLVALALLFFFFPFVEEIKGGELVVAVLLTLVLISTLSTVGYGDITPVSHVARTLAALEAMTGLLYVAVQIARLVSLYSSRKSSDS
jgi:hypothetical protein